MRQAIFAVLVFCAWSHALTGDGTIFSFQTRLLNPEGEWVDVIPWSVQGRSGEASVAWRAAENDPAGAWNLEI